MEEDEPSNIEIPATLNNQEEEAPFMPGQDVNPPQKEEPVAPKTAPLESNDRGDPKLYVDVNIGRAGVGLERIVVFEGDTAESLA